MPLQPGDALGPYHVVEKLGEGGMGDVFRARDARVGRDVAIKRSRDAFAERFTREAHAIAALNHPNVCTLYDVGPDYLVMELVDGPTLAERVAAGPLPLDEALAIARQIAGALDAAHEQGIVHRDLKPANVKITPAGTVKVLDFGLAKALAPAGAAGGSAAAASIDSPTLSMQATQAGMILGTAAYMAPEQVRGKPVDQRADIWAFGVVLHEMVTGRRLFQGDDLTETLAAVVKTDPDLDDAPPSVRRLLRRCLEKDPAKRLRHIGDVWDLVDDDAAAATPAVARRGSTHLVPALAAGIGVLAAALAALAWIHVREARPASIHLPAVTMEIEAPPDTRFARRFVGTAASPDGRFIVFSAGAAEPGVQAAEPSLWLRALDDRSVRRLPGTEFAAFPTWSPDSRSLAFVGDTFRLKRIDIAGGAPLTLDDTPLGPAGTAGGTWNRDDIILVGSGAGLRRVSASGGGSMLLTEVADGETAHSHPQFLPDGRRFLFFVESADPGVQGVYASSLDAPARRQLVVRTASKAVYVPPRGGAPGYLLWLQGETLVAQPFDAESLQRAGTPVTVAEGIPGGVGGAAFFASDAGLLAYFTATSVRILRSPIVWVSRNGTRLGDAVPEDSYSGLALSPDAGRLAVQRQTPDGADIWIWNFARETMTRLTDIGRVSPPVWSPDGRHLAFASSRGGASGIYRIDVSGTGQVERLVEGPGQPLDWSRDGRYLLYRVQGEAGLTGRGTLAEDMDLMALPLDGDREPFSVVNTRFRESHGKFSPDGRWLAYGSTETGAMEVYVQAFGGADAAARTAGRWQISNAGGGQPRWRADSRELYYLSSDSRVMAVSIEAGPQGLHPGPPRPLFPEPAMTQTALHSVDVTGDGQRFLLRLTPREEEAGTNRLTAIANWQTRLRR